MTEFVSITEEGFQGYELGEKTKSAILVVQEGVGVNQILKTIGKEIHQRTGFRVLIPDLYDGAYYEDINALIEKYFKNKDPTDTLNAWGFKINKATEYLKKTGSPKVGFVGFCLGGAYAYYCAQHTDIVCSNAFYGNSILIENLNFMDVNKLKQIPFQVFQGNDDEVPNSLPQYAKKYQGILTQNGVPNKFNYFDGAGHGYMNAICKEGEEKLRSQNFPVPPKSVMDDTWNLLVANFNENLK